MASSISPWFIASYDAALHAVPEHGARLKDTVRIKSGVVGETHRFPAMGKVIARSRPTFQPIETAPFEKKKPEARLRNAEHFAHLDEYEVSQTNVTAAPGYARGSRMAVERACDQRIIEAWGINAGDTRNTEAIGLTIPQSGETTSATAAHPVGGPRPVAVPANAVTPEKLARILTQLKVRGVGKGDMLTFAHNDVHFQWIAQIDQLLSRDYSERGFMATGDVPPIYGMQWRGIEARDEGGIDSNVGIVYAKASTGLAEGTVQRMRVTDWLPQLQLWQIGAKINVGATAIDNNMMAETTLAVS